VEPLTLADPRRCKFTMFPIRHADVWDMYRRAERSMWTDGEVDLSADRACFEKLTANEQLFITNVLAFFASSDGIVNENLSQNFYNDIPIPEVRAFYSFQMSIETVHSIVYSQLIDEIIRDEEKKACLFRSIESIACVRLKTEWAMRWTNRETATFGERLVAFAAVEGIFFSGSFCAIFWLKKRGLMPGMCVANEFISRDEGLHRDFACLLFKKLSRPPSAERVRQIIREAVECEKLFVSESLPVSLIGMSAELMCQYIEFVSDHLLRSLGLASMYGAPNPFDWMNLISMDQKSNFFEKRETGYSRASADQIQPSLEIADMDF
jgi:ribonucleoside-diphosphate reductase subunit M2